jgi:hypothetical protein
VKGTYGGVRALQAHLDLLQRFKEVAETFEQA